MRQNPHVRICGGPGSATTLVYPTQTLLDTYERGLVPRPRFEVMRKSLCEIDHDSEDRSIDGRTDHHCFHRSGFGDDESIVET